MIQLISTVLLLGLFGSPVLFTPEMIEGLPHFVHVLVAWNPITPFLGLFRACLVDTQLLWRDVWLAPLWAAVFFGFGVWTFRRLEPGMADCLWS